MALSFNPAGNVPVPDPPVCELITLNLTGSPTLKFKYVSTVMVSLPITTSADPKVPFVPAGL